MTNKKEKLNKLKIGEVKLKDELLIISNEIKSIEYEIDNDELNNLINSTNQKFKENHQAFRVEVVINNGYKIIYLKDIKRNIKYQLNYNLDNLKFLIKTLKQLKINMPFVIQLSEFLKYNEKMIYSSSDLKFRASQLNSLIPNYEIYFDLDLFNIENNEFAFKLFVFNSNLSKQDIICLTYKLNEFLKNELNDEAALISINMLNSSSQRLSIYYDTENVSSIEILKNHNGLVKLIQKIIDEINQLINKK